MSVNARRVPSSLKVCIGLSTGAMTVPESPSSTRTARSSCTNVKERWTTWSVSWAEKTPPAPSASAIPAGLPTGSRTMPMRIRIFPRAAGWPSFTMASSRISASSRMPSFPTDTPSAAARTPKCWSISSNTSRTRMNARWKKPSGWRSARWWAPMPSPSSSGATTTASSRHARVRRWPSASGKGSISSVPTPRPSSTTRRSSCI